MTSIPALAIRRPVLAWMIMAALVFFGLISFRQLGVSQMPDVDFPVLSVSVDWQGAAPSVIESEIVDRLEDAITSVEGVKELSSTLRQGQATISIEFELNRDIDVALQEVQSAISRVKLPLEVDQPTIKKSNPDDQPIIWLGISGSRSLHDLTEFVDLFIKDQFQILPGVGEIFMGGFTERNLRILVDNAKLRASELTILDISNAIRQEHLETAAGRIENNEREIQLRVMGEGITPEDVGNILIATRGGRPIYQHPIRIRDIASVEDGLNDIRRAARVNGKTAIGLGIKKQRGANAVEVGSKIKNKLVELRPTLPPDINLNINFDSTVFIKDSVEETEFTLFLSAIATALVCWLFLGSLRPTFNVLLSIPTSIIGSFAVIYFMGFTLNFFTILGLALAIGIVVDDAIMVLENIYRHRDMGKDKVKASQEGTEEITFAAIAASIAVIAIFLPVAFMKGVIGKFFFQFGITISAAVALSLLEAITLTPMRCSQFLDTQDEQSSFARRINAMFESLSLWYKDKLHLCLTHSWIVLGASTIIFAFSLLLIPLIRKEFIPPQDQSLFLLRVQTPVGTSLHATSKAMEKVEEYLRARTDVVTVYTTVGGFNGGEVNAGQVFVTLTPQDSRPKSQTVIMNEVRAALNNPPALKVIPQGLSTRGFTAQRGFPVEFNIRGPDWKILEEKSLEITKRLGESGLLIDIDTDYRLGQPELRIWPDRNKALERGVSIEALTNTISTAIGSTRQGKFTNSGRRYDVRIGLAADQRQQEEVINDLQVRNVHGELISVADLVHIEKVPTLQTITRKNRERAISFFASVVTGRSQAEAIQYAERIAKEILPSGYSVHLGGNAQTFSDSFNSLYSVMVIGLIVAYMILASQFNSYLHPITVLLALPFSVTGALAAIYITGQSINLFSMIGIILLMGIVKKNSILLVEFINYKLEHSSLTIRQAIQEASPVRLRPILMTSLATIAAAIPPALAIGPGAESRIPMSITIIGGVIISTIFTLFVVPCAYNILCARKPYRG